MMKFDYKHWFETKKNTLEFTDTEEFTEFTNMSNEDVEKYDKLSNPGHVDEGTWDKAKKAASKSSAGNKWALTSYIYEKMGGKFNK